MYDIIYKLMFTIIIAVMAWLVYLITGRNKRQIKSIPKNMMIMCIAPRLRYIMYAIGIFVILFMAIVSVVFISSGATEEAIEEWTLCIIISVICSISMIMLGYVMAKSRIYFNEEYMQIGKLFKKLRTVKWHEIQRIEGDIQSSLKLYDLDGNKIVEANASLVNYEHFCNVLKKEAQGAFKEYNYTKNVEKGCVVRCGSDIYILAVIGILGLVLFLYGIKFDYNECMKLMNDSSLGWFQKLILPVCGLCGILTLIFALRRRIVYSESNIIISYLLGKKIELSWREIKEIQIVIVEKYKEKKITKLSFNTSMSAYKVNLFALSYGKDDFITEILKNAKKYDIKLVEGKG